MRTRLLLAGLIAALAAACSTAVTGQGTFAGGPAPVPSGTTPAASSAVPSPPPTSATGGGRSALSCSGGTVISPAGAPYCYLLPAGFLDVSSSITVGASVGNEKFRTGVALAARDLIIVTVYQLRLDADPIPDGTLVAQLQTVLAQLATQGFTFDSTTPSTSQVDGARAFTFHAREQREQLQADVTFVFRAATEVEVNCQSQTRAADVRRGCGQVLSSLQIKSLS